MKTIRETKRDAVREAILSAGREIIESEGFSNLSIRKIATRIGYSPAAIYSYYPGKNDLLNALISTKYAEMIKTIDSAKGANPLKTFEAKIKAYVAFALSNRDYYEAMMLSKDKRVLKATSIFGDANTVGMSRLIETIEAIRSTDTIPHPGSLDTARFVWTSVFGLIIRIITEGIVLKETIDALVDAHLKRLTLTVKGDSHA